MVRPRLTTPAMDRFIESYYRRGVCGPDICYYVERTFNVQLTPYYLRRHLLPRLGLCRWGRNQTPVIDVLHDYLEVVNQVGYINTNPTRMTRMLRNQFGHNLTRRMVQRINQNVLPEMVAERQRRRLVRRTYRSMGPDFTWHLDGYDKLAAWGLPIHGCLDGYSRRLMWLSVCYTNHNPRHICHLFINTVQQFGIPHTARMDAGTENGHVRQAQTILAAQFPRIHPNPPVIVGSSHRNQRIERFWGQLAEQITVPWIDEFVKLEGDGLFIRWDRYDRMLSYFVFSDIVQGQVLEFMEYHNDHRVRRQRNRDIPTGLVHAMYNYPEARGAQRCSNPARRQDLDQIRQDLCEEVGQDRDFYQLAMILCNDLHLVHPPVGTEEATQMFRQLRPLIQQLFA